MASEPTITLGPDPLLSSGPLPPSTYVKADFAKGGADDGDWHVDGKKNKAGGWSFKMTYKGKPLSVDLTCPFFGGEFDWNYNGISKKDTETLNLKLVTIEASGLPAKAKEAYLKSCRQTLADSRVWGQTLANHVHHVGSTYGKKTCDVDREDESKTYPLRTALLVKKIPDLSPNSARMKKLKERMKGKDKDEVPPVYQVSVKILSDYDPAEVRKRRIITPIFINNKPKAFTRGELNEFVLKKRFLANVEGTIEGNLTPLGLFMKISAEKLYLQLIPSSRPQPKSKDELEKLAKEGAAKFGDMGFDESMYVEESSGSSSSPGSPDKPSSSSDGRGDFVDVEKD